MAAKQQQQQQIAGEGFTSSHIAGMSKTQLYDIMSQMKVLIQQNQQQARQILIDNPLLTRALFQAQIMLGMVQVPQVMPNIPKSLSQPSSVQAGHQPNAQTTQPMPVQGGLHGQASSSQPSVPPRQQHLTQPSISIPIVSAPPSTFPSQSMPSNPPHSAQQTKGFLNAPQVPSVAPPQSPQIHNVPLPPPPVPPHYSIVQPHVPMVSGQMQQPLQTPGILHQPLQPPLPQQPRPPSMQPFSHQPHSQMPNGLVFQASSTPQPLLSQPMFHSAINPPTMFPHGQPTLPSHQVPQQFYQGGPHIGSDYGNPAGTSMQAEKGAPWAPGLPERATGGPQMLLQPPLIPGQMAPSTGGQLPRPPPLTPEMEKVLVQQVMSLTPEQINLLPLEQRQQVMQLQEMLRH